MENFQVPGTLVYNPFLLNFKDPLDFKTLLGRFPLDLGFVSWSVENNVRVLYDSELPKDYTGLVTLVFNPEIRKTRPNSGLIRICPSLDPEEKDLVLVHELIHIAIPDQRLCFPNCWSLFQYKQYEKAIDDCSRDHIKNRTFFDYLKNSIPFSSN